MGSVTSNFYSQIRTRSILEPEFLYDKKYKLDSVPEVLKMDFSRILNKPFFVRNITWNITDFRFTNIGFIKLPLDVFTNVLAQVPFESSTLYRAKMSIILQVAGTPMHQGVVLVSAMPIGFSSDPTTIYGKKLINSFMAAPHVFLNANEQTSVRLRVPFYVNSHLEKTDLDGTTVSPNFGGTDFSEITFTVLSPLNPPVSGTSSLSISVHAVFDDLEFYAPHVDVTYTPQPAFVPQGLLDNLKMAGTRAIDSLFTTARRLTGDLLDVGRGAIRQYTGLHSPNLPFTTNKIYTQQRNVLNTTDNQVSFDKMDNFANFDRILDDFYFETAQDEMDLRYLGSKPQYLGYFTVNFADRSGALLWSRNITPAQEYNADSYVNYNGEVIDTYSYSNIQQILYNIHKYWRGTIKIHLQSVMSNFQFCKLAVARDYSIRTGAFTSYPTFASVPNLMTEFIEFSAGGQIQTIEFPYVSPLNQTPCSYDWFNMASQHGMYYIYLNQPLVTNGSVNQAVSFNVYISLGDDFDWYGYNADPHRMNFPIGVSKLPQNPVPEIPAIIPVPEKEEKKDAVFLMGFEAQAAAPVPVNDQSELTAKENTATLHCAKDLRPVTHLRDHVRRFYKVYRKGIVDASTLDGLLVLPVAQLLGGKPSNSAGRSEYVSTLDLISKMFLGSTGGARFKIVVGGTSMASAWFVPPSYGVNFNNNDIVYQGLVPRNNNANASGAYLANVMYRTLTLSSSGIDTSFSAQCPALERANYHESGYYAVFAEPGEDVNYVPDSTSLLELEVPYLAPYKFVGDVTKFAYANGVFNDTATTNLGHIVINIPPTAIPASSRVGCNVTIWASFDDTNRLGYQVNVPSILVPGYKDSNGKPYVLSTQNYASVSTVGNYENIPSQQPFGTPSYFKYSYFAKLT